ncbi:hypothetical protein TGS27_0363 [Geobacillus stearothermophilus]|uniref:Uncharacterized protein n=1 Tax=Geobacillus stearothermophilus TaxID=1422 RepID=A0ABQ7HDX2_GEOSE|nr:hypothetical protein GS8_2540 [Geobacillus stearothermophilus]OAO87704.1 hypothetical protein TGS27_0363 [Geobacillus stearothermophilus]
MGALVHVGKIVPFPTIRIRLNVNAKVVKLDHTSSPSLKRMEIFVRNNSQKI